MLRVGFVARHGAIARHNRTPDSNRHGRFAGRIGTGVEPGSTCCGCNCAGKNRHASHNVYTRTRPIRGSCGPKRSN